MLMEFLQNILGAGSGSNQGDDPKTDFLKSKVNFSPEYTAIIHIELLKDHSINFFRYHYPAHGESSWDILKKDVISNIEDFNEGRFPKKDETRNLYASHGPKNIIFHSQHNIFIYIKNKELSIFEEYPIWFGDRLIGTIDSPTTRTAMNKFSKNRSFCAVETKTLDEGTFGKGFSSQLIYMKNYHVHKDGWLSSYRRVRNKEELAYSMNIVAEMESRYQVDCNSESTKTPVIESVRIPVIIDPDTGNMGGGAPLFGP